MNILYKTARILLSPLPDRWNNKDTQGAVAAIIIVSGAIAGAWALFGCAGYQVNAEYEHHSSVPQNSDLNTTDQAGVCVEYPLSKHRYATEMEVCLHIELDRDKPVFGDDPVGTVRIKQPIYRSAK